MPDAVNLYLDSRRIGAGTMVDEFERRKNRVRAKVRAKIEHPYRILKRVFGFVPACFPGLHAQPAQTDSVRGPNCRLLRPTCRPHISLAEMRRNLRLLRTLRLRALTAKGIPRLPAVFLRNLALQPPGAPIIVVRETLQHLVEAIPDVRSHGSVGDQRISAAQRFS